MSLPLFEDDDDDDDDDDNENDDGAALETLDHNLSKATRAQRGGNTERNFERERENPRGEKENFKAHAPS